jgi:hypothetical protein
MTLSRNGAAQWARDASLAAEAKQRSDSIHEARYYDVASTRKIESITIYARCDGLSQSKKGCSVQFQDAMEAIESIP